MKKILLSLSIFLSLTLVVQSQPCSPNSFITGFGFPGIYPIGSIPISGIPSTLPIPIGINDGQVNVPYDETLTLVVLEDTTMDIGFLLDMIDPAITSLMNSAGISTTMSVDVNHVTFDIQGLPNNLTYTCDINN